MSFSAGCDPFQMTEHRITSMSHSLGCSTMRHEFLLFINVSGYDVADESMYLFHPHLKTIQAIPTHPGLPSSCDLASSHQCLPRTLSHTDILILESGVKSESSGL